MRCESIALFFGASVSVYNSQDHINYIFTILKHYLNLNHLNVIFQCSFSRYWEKFIIYVIPLIKMLKKLTGKIR